MIRRQYFVRGIKRIDRKNIPPCDDDINFFLDDKKTTPKFRLPAVSHMRTKYSTISQYRYIDHNTFCFKLPPFGGTRINECTTQGKVTRKLKERKIDTQFFIVTIQQF